MPLQAQILGGPRDGEYIPVTEYTIHMLDEPLPIASYTEELALVDLQPLPVGVYDLQRYDDCQLFYVRRSARAML